MNKLTKLQSSVLELAAASASGFTTAPTDAPEAKVKAAVAGLIKAGLMIGIPDGEGGQARLLITESGRASAPPAAVATLAAASPIKTVKSSKSKPTEAAAPPPQPEGPKGKIGVLVALLRRDGGATIADMMTATSWQAHSVRGAVSGSLKKGLGLTVISEKIGDQRTYRIAQDAA